jgi:hypothetical protein
LVNTARIAAWEHASVEGYVRRCHELRETNGALAGSNIWRFDVFTRILAHRISIRGVDDPYRRAHLIRTALGALTPGDQADVVSGFTVALERAATQWTQRDSRTFRVIYPINLQSLEAKAIRTVSVLGLRVKRLEWAEVGKRSQLAAWWRTVDRVAGTGGRDSLRRRFVPFELLSSAATAEEAWERASPKLELLRTVLNLQTCWGIIAMQGGQPSPMGGLHPSPLFAVIGDAAEEPLWLHTPTNFRQSPFSPPDIDWRQARRLLARLSAIREHDVRQLVVEALLRYGQALETIEWKQAFLALWQILEMLAAQSKDELSMRETRNRISLLLGQREGERDLIEVLADTRNAMVHAGRFPDRDGLEELQYLKAIVEWSIDAFLDRRSLIQRVSDLRVLYEHLGRPDTELRHRKRVIGAIQRRRARAKRGGS